MRLTDEALPTLESKPMRFTKIITAVSLLSLAAVPAIATAAQPAAQQAAQTIEISVTGEGFVPANIQVKKGQPVKLVVTRKTERTCATEIVIRELGINQPLPLNKPVTVQFTPVKSGQLRYACGMDMISGVIVVQ